MGEAESYDFPSVDFKKPIEPQRKKVPAAIYGIDWKKKRPASLKDTDQLELLRAYFAVELFDEYDFDDVEKLSKGRAKEGCLAVLGEVVVPS